MQGSERVGEFEAAPVRDLGTTCIGPSPEPNTGAPVSKTPETRSETRSKRSSVFSDFRRASFGRWKASTWSESIVTWSTAAWIRRTAVCAVRSSPSTAFRRRLCCTKGVMVCSLCRSRSSPLHVAVRTRPPGRAVPCTLAVRQQGRAMRFHSATEMLDTFGVARGGKAYRRFVAAFERIFGATMFFGTDSVRPPAAWCNGPDSISCGSADLVPT